ncbi:unnamed protein product [Nyctereutes procyonoides]|uniref:(raccoon dog) hypothetical protein n=1 Tax=Nyctereutes procyonoides TaxID=34880 RepID=A0A811ZNV3_NYCPR|nr:unnamed protein product [Nyctereutes procyonoides]
MGHLQAMKPPGAQGSQSTYTDLLSVTEEIDGHHPCLALVRECLAETEKNART